MYQTKLVDYDKVVTELMKGLIPLSAYPLADREVAFKKLRTVGFSGPRQTGKSHYLLTFFMDHHEESLLILRDGSMRELFLEMCNELSASCGDLKVSKQRDVPRVFEQSAFIKLNRSKEDKSIFLKYPIKPVRYILVDGCHSQYLDKPLYKWIANHAEDDAVIIKAEL